MNARRTSRTAASDRKWSVETAGVFGELRRIIGSTMGHFLLGSWLAPMLHRYFGRVATRLGRLLDAIEAGRLKPLAGRKARVAREKVAEAEVAEAAAVEKQPWELVTIPRRKLWLAKMFAGKVGWGAGIGVGTGAIEYFVQRPEVMALLAREPARVRRILGPLARWTGMHVPVLVAHPAPRRVRVRPKVARVSVAERKAELWYPNIENKPIDLWRESRLIERAAKKARLGE